MRTKNVIVVSYDPRWAQEFSKLKAHLETALKGRIMSIEHVGSTSVEWLPAKPILDVDVVMRSYDDFPGIKSSLENLGYWHEGDLGIKGREAFAYSEQSEFMTHHLYVCPQDSSELKRHLAFRDYLRTHPADRDKYGDVKRKAALMYPTDIDGYLEKKGPVVEAIYRKIGLV